MKPKTKKSTWAIGGLFAVAIFALVSGGGNTKECPALDPASFGLPDDKAEAMFDFMAKAERLRASGVCPSEGSFGRSHNKFYFAVFDVHSPKKKYFVRLNREQLRNQTQGEPQQTQHSPEP